MKIDFLIAGVQKAGTTTIFHHLAKHPEIFIPEQKEIHFFDNEADIDWLKPDYSVYHKHFQNHAKGMKTGEATPIYLFWPPSLERIKKYNSEIKLLIVLRDPVKRAYSHWAMEKAKGRENISFSDAIRIGRKRISSNFNGLDRSWEIYTYLERGLYYEQLTRMFDLFRSEQILLLTLNELANDLAYCLQKIYRFLSVDDSLEPAGDSIILRDEKLQNLPPLGNEDRRYLENFYREDIIKAEQFTGRLIREWNW